MALRSLGTVTGIYGIRRLQVKRSGRLGAGPSSRLTVADHKGPIAVLLQKCTRSPPEMGYLEQLHPKSARGHLKRRETWRGFVEKVRAVSSVGSQCVINENTPSSYDDRVSYKKVAATYSPTWWGSTIGDGELNFSVRNGKRWILTAITATVCF